MTLRLSVRGSYVCVYLCFYAHDALLLSNVTFSFVFFSSFYFFDGLQPQQYDESLAAHYGGMEMYGDPHAAHRSALASSHSHHSVSVSPASAAAAAAAAHLNSHGAAAAAAAAAAMHHSAAAAAAAAAQQHSQSPYHSLGNHVSAQQVGANHMTSTAASSSVPDVHKRDKDAIYGYVNLF
jgi:hypothetical protein